MSNFEGFVLVRIDDFLNFFFDTVEIRLRSCRSDLKKIILKRFVDLFFRGKNGIFWSVFIKKNNMKLNSIRSQLYQQLLG